MNINGGCAEVGVGISVNTDVLGEPVDGACLYLRATSKIQAKAMGGFLAQCWWRCGGGCVMNSLQAVYKCAWLSECVQIKMEMCVGV